MDLKRLRVELRTLFSALAAEDMRQPLAEGIVTWLDAATPFISPECQAGIYLKILSHHKPGRPGTRYDVVTINGTQKLQPIRTRQERLVLNISAKSLEENDDYSSQLWIEHILDNIWDRQVLSKLKRMGLSIIRIEPTLSLQSKDPVDGSDGIDNRGVIVVSVDIRFQYLNIIYGLPVDYIDNVSAGGTIHGGTSDPIHMDLGDTT